jgi:hypothetical protein
MPVHPQARPGPAGALHLHQGQQKAWQFFVTNP